MTLIRCALSVGHSLSAQQALEKVPGAGSIAAGQVADHMLRRVRKYTPANAMTAVRANSPH